MTKIVRIILYFLILTNTSCLSDNSDTTLGDTNPRPMASESTQASISPQASPHDIEKPPSPMPIVRPSVTVSPPVIEGIEEFEIFSAEAIKNNFKYDFVIKGSGMGLATDYDFLEIKVSSFTAPLIRNGVLNIGDASNITISADEIKFTWRANSPTDYDRLQVRYKSKEGKKGESLPIRLLIK